MTALLSLSLSPIYRALRRWIIRRKLASIACELEFIAKQRKNDQRVERILMSRQALLQSDLRNI